MLADGHAFGCRRCNISMWAAVHHDNHVTIMRQCWAAEGAGKSCLEENSSSVKMHDFDLSVCRRCTTINMGCSCCKGKAFIVWLINGNTLRVCIHHIYTVLSKSRLTFQKVQAANRMSAQTACDTDISVKGMLACQSRIQVVAEGMWTGCRLPLLHSANQNCLFVAHDVP